MDQSKKTMRHFYCRDVLWETFEQMANDFDCSIDYLINESMRYYARSKNYPAAGGPSPSASGQGAPGAGAPASVPPRRPQPSTQPPAPSASMPSAPPAARRPAPPTPAGHMGAMAPAPAPAPRGPSANAGPSGGFAGGGYGQSAPPAAVQSSPGVVPAATPPGGSTLFLTFNGQRYPVAKDQFIIGRGSKTSDLAIKDGNISRKHAAVIRRNGTFYIKDLGSTNGIDYKGMRIDNKRIDEGDVFHLCDYELRFTYRAD